jgi:hypothetical protein
MFSKKGESKSPDWKQAKGDMKMPRTHPMCAASNKCGLKSGKSGAGGVAQMVQHLSSKNEALSSNPSTAKSGKSNQLGVCIPDHQGLPRKPWITPTLSLSVLFYKIGGNSSFHQSC